jgi:hypothetical protein
LRKSRLSSRTAGSISAPIVVNVSMGMTTPNPSSRSPNAASTSTSFCLTANMVPLACVQGSSRFWYERPPGSPKVHTPLRQETFPPFTSSEKKPFVESTTMSASPQIFVS